MIAAVTGASQFRELGGQELVSPPLLWSEVRSVLHEAAWRGDLSKDTARRGLDNLEKSPIEPRSPAKLGTRAWELADRLGWSKTYDAEYLALAQLLRVPLITLDGGLRDAAERLGIQVVAV